MITKRERFPIGEWSRQVKDKGNALLQTNESIQNIQSQIDITCDSYEKLKGETAVLEGKINELKRKVRRILLCLIIVDYNDACVLELIQVDKLVIFCLQYTCRSKDNISDFHFKCVYVDIIIK